MGHLRRVTIAEAAGPARVRPSRSLDHPNTAPALGRDKGITANVGAHHSPRPTLSGSIRNAADHPLLRPIRRLRPRHAHMPMASLADREVVMDKPRDHHYTVGIIPPMDQDHCRRSVPSKRPQPPAEGRDGGGVCRSCIMAAGPDHDGTLHYLRSAVVWARKPHWMKDSNLDPSAVVKDRLLNPHHQQQ